jgi:hypothetical protein
LTDEAVSTGTTADLASLGLVGSGAGLTGSGATDTLAPDLSSTGTSLSLTPDAQALNNKTKANRLKNFFMKSPKNNQG